MKKNHMDVQEICRRVLTNVLANQGNRAVEFLYHERDQTRSSFVWRGNCC